MNTSLRMTDRQRIWERRSNTSIGGESECGRARGSCSGWGGRVCGRRGGSCAGGERGSCAGWGGRVREERGVVCGEVRTRSHIQSSVLLRAITYNIYVNLFSCRTKLSKLWMKIVKYLFNNTINNISIYNHSPFELVSILYPYLKRKMRSIFVTMSVTVRLLWHKMNQT